MIPVDTYESRFRQVIREVKESDFFEVLHSAFGPGGTGGDPSGVFEVMKKNGIPLDSHLKEAYFPYRNIALFWSLEIGSIELVGDFNVMNLPASSEEMVDVDDFAWGDEDRPLLSELSALDEIYRGGSGQLAAMRFLPGLANPEIWFLDAFHTIIKLDLDYRQYLDGLLVTKGVVGWQYLFADVNFGGREYKSIRDSLKSMLDLFPDIFPSYDYSPLVARLEARL